MYLSLMVMHMRSPFWGLNRDGHLPNLFVAFVVFFYKASHSIILRQVDTVVFKGVVAQKSIGIVFFDVVVCQFIVSIVVEFFHNFVFGVVNTQFGTTKADNTALKQNIKMDNTLAIVGLYLSYLSPRHKRNGARNGIVDDMLFEALFSH